MDACMKGNSHVVRALLEKGANIEAKDKVTTLMMVEMMGRYSGSKYKLT